MDVEVVEPSLALNHERAAWQGQPVAARLARLPPLVAELVD
jgi:hypothetical protein